MDPNPNSGVINALTVVIRLLSDHADMIALQSICSSHAVQADGL